MDGSDTSAPLLATRRHCTLKPTQKQPLAPACSSSSSAQSSSSVVSPLGEMAVEPGIRQSPREGSRPLPLDATMPCRALALAAAAARRSCVTREQRPSQHPVKTMHTHSSAQDDEAHQLVSVLRQAAERCLASSSDEALQLVQPLPGLTLLQSNAKAPLEAMLYEPVLCLVLRGAKQVYIASQSFNFGPGECLLVSHLLPVQSRIHQAPYLALVLHLDFGILGELQDELAADLDEQPAAAAQTHRADPALLDAFQRYLSLTESPTQAKVLAPLLAKELHFRLLIAPFGGMLRTRLRPDSNANAIARAIHQLRAELQAPLSVAKLARHVAMSESAFYKHFKALTATTPLTYQKELRLLEARRLLRLGGFSVSSTAFEVGYQSPSQFSREYARKFGVAPSQELRQSKG